MRVLATGGAGYIGCVLTRMLLDAGHDVVVYDKMLFGDKMVRDAIAGAKVVVGDILDEAALTACLPFDLCCHLAAVSNDPSAELDKETTDRINVDGTDTVAAICAAENIPMVIASTASVYGFIEWELSTEFSVLNPQSHYGKSKVAMEGQIAQLRAAYPDWQVMMFRQATVYGWSPRMRYDLVVNTMVKDAFTKGYIDVHGGGECWRPLVSVQDVARAYVHAAELVAGGKPFPAAKLNLVHKNYRISELASWIAYVLRDKAELRIYSHHDQVKDTRSYAISDELAGAAGFRCEQGIAECAIEVWDKLAAGVTADVENPIYYNHRWLSMLRDAKARIEEGNWGTIP